MPTEDQMNVISPGKTQVNTCKEEQLISTTIKLYTVTINFLFLLICISSVLCAKGIACVHRVGGGTDVKKKKCNIRK